MCSQIWRSSEFNSAQRPLRPPSQLQPAQGPEKDRWDTQRSAWVMSNDVKNLLFVALRKSIQRANSAARVNLGMTTNFVGNYSQSHRWLPMVDHFCWFALASQCLSIGIPSSLISIFLDDANLKKNCCTCPCHICHFRLSLKIDKPPNLICFTTFFPVTLPRKKFGAASSTVVELRSFSFHRRGFRPTTWWVKNQWTKTMIFWQKNSQKIIKKIYDLHDFGRVEELNQPRIWSDLIQPITWHGDPWGFAAKPLPRVWTWGF